MFWDAYRSATHWINTLDKQEWLMVLIGVVLIGAFCLKGFGRKASY